MWGKKKTIYFLIMLVFLIPALCIIVDIADYTHNSERMEEEYHSKAI